MKKHISLIILTASLTALPMIAQEENILNTTASLARNTILASAGLTACAFSALAAHTYTAARLVNTDALSKIDDKEMKRKGEILGLANPIQNASGFIGSVTAIAGASAVYNGVKGMVKDIKKMIHFFNGTTEPKETTPQVPTQPLSQSKKLASIALHTAQLLGGVATTTLGTFATVGSTAGEVFALQDDYGDLTRNDKRFIKAGMTLGTNAGLGLGVAGIATMIYGIKGLYNDYNQL